MRIRSLILLLLPAVLAAGQAARAAEIELPAGPGRDLVYGKCRTCHDLQYLKESAGITRDDWDQLLISMRQYGLRIPPEQREKIIDYLGTYLGPNPPPAAPAAQVAAAPADGRVLFENQCSACHQHGGTGVDGQFPPLAGNRDLFLSREFPAMVVLNGLRGTISVRGAQYNAVMPPFAHLSDEEIAAVVRYVRGAWGNDGLRPSGLAPIDAAAVAVVRKRQLGADGVHAQRQALNR